MKNPHPLSIVDPTVITNLKSEARNSSRLRAALPIHKEYSDPVQRVLMAANPETYVGPHLHPNKAWEMVIVLEGALDLLLFSTDGVVENRISLNVDGNRIFEYPANQFHAAVILQPDTVVFEVKEGPYIVETAKELPDWAPEEQSDHAGEFNRKMKTLQPGQSV